MRLVLAIVAFCLVLAAPPVRGAHTFPYKAYITADDVYVRCGPGQSYYPTDKLKAGQEVEIYRHDPGGWYAIKPPAGSFAWISGRYLQPGKENLAVVTDDRLAARVGSRFSDIRDVIQVRLHKGEVVEVLEAKPSADRSTTWYKIAPPSGEFRWVFGKYIDPDYPRDGIRKTHAAGQLRRTDDAGLQADAAVAEADAVSWKSDVSPQVSSPPTATPAERKLQPPVEDSPAIEVPSSGELAWQPTQPQEPTFAPVTPRGMSPEAYQAALEEIDVELSAMVVEEPTVWAFQEMRDRSQSLLGQAETAVERGRARVLVNKMDRFEAVKQRHDEINAPRTQYERSHRQFATLAQRDRDVAPLAQRDWDVAPPPDLESRYDGVGQLTRVVSPRLDAPRYALLDGAGGVRCYVSPAPGVRLRHYLGQQIGVSGSRGYMPEQRAYHVMARHVSPLAPRMR